MKGLLNKNYTEQIRLIAKVDNLEALTKTAQRVAELIGKKGYVLVDSYIEEGEQNYYLEEKTPA